MRDKLLEIKFNINEETKEIAAYYNAPQNEIEDIIMQEVCEIIAKHHTLYVDPDIICKAVAKQSAIKAFHMSGVARLHPEDIYDEETGKKVARRRLRSKYRTVRNEILRACWKQIQYSYTVMKHNIEKCLHTKWHP